MKLSWIFSLALLGTTALALPASAQNTTAPAATPAAETSTADDPSVVPADEAAAPKEDPARKSAAARDWEIEYSVWKAASDGGAISDYEAYLDTYPEGHFAGVARSRIAKLSGESETPADSSATVIEQGSADPDADSFATDMTADTGEADTAMTPGNASDDNSYADTDDANADAPVTQAAVKSDKAESRYQRNDMPELSLGTPEEERDILDRPARREIQGRLTSLGFSTRGVDGVFGPRSRNAIADWQDANGAPVSSYLSQDQVTLIRQQSIESYVTWLQNQPKRIRRPRTVVRRVYRTAPRRNNDAAAAAIFGLAAGAIIGTAAARHHHHRRYRRFRRW